jgi:exopolysaccharide biosynthesis protein
MLDMVVKAGLDTTSHYRGGRYHISVDGWETEDEARKVLEHLSSFGISDQLAVQEYGQDVTNPDGPWEIHILEADTRLVDVEVAHAYDAAIGLETTSGLARRRGALAAINGGYYLRSGILRGDSQGILQIDGTLLSEPDRGRAAAGFYDDGKKTRAVFGRLSLRHQLVLDNGERIRINGVNRRRGKREVVFYTPEFHRTTLTSPDGAEIAVREGRIASINPNAGSSMIPASGYVISLGAGLVGSLLSQFKIGHAIEVEMKLEPLSPDPTGEWTKAQFILGGGPLLLLDGRRLEEPQTESISRVFFLSRHPRTAVGMRADGTLLFVVVDGRQPGRSVGMSLRELTDLFIELGAVSAINLDGGGSSTMATGNDLVNRPSDPTGERETGNAVLLFPRTRY